MPKLYTQLFHMETMAGQQCIYHYYDKFTDEFIFVILCPMESEMNRR